MPWRETLSRQFCEPFDRWVRSIPDETAAQMTDLCLLAGQNPMIRLADGGLSALREHTVLQEQLRNLLACVCGYALYACQHQLQQGFLTLRGGFRVGFGGCYTPNGLDPARIQAMVIRITRPCTNCAEPIVQSMQSLESCLIVSPPGMGKTTVLRDLVRLVSNRGYWVGLCDERGEIAAAEGGEASLDVGPCTVVADGCDKSEGMSRLLRAVHPQILAADELGGEEEARAVLQAQKSGSAVFATVHACDEESLRRRGGMNELLDAGVFGRVVFLGGRPGKILQICRMEQP